jgi:hypothetical protein
MEEKYHIVTFPDGDQYRVLAPADATPQHLKNKVLNELYGGDFETWETTSTSAPAPAPASTSIFADTESDNKTAGLIELQTQLAKLQKEKKEDKNYNVIKNLWGGFGQGITQTFESGALGAAEAWHSDPTKEDVARQKIIDAADWVEETAESVPLLGVEVDDDAITTNVGRALGSVAAFVGTTAAAVGTVAYLAPAGVITTAAAYGAPFLLGYLGAVGEQSERARAAGATLKQRQDATSINPFKNPGLYVAGGLEILPVSRYLDIGILSRVTQGIGPEFADKVLNYAGRAVVGGGIEGAQEAASNFMQNLTESEYNELRGWLDGTGASLGYGSTAGGITQLVADLFNKKARRKYRDNNSPITVDQVLKDNPEFLEMSEAEVLKTLNEMVGTEVISAATAEGVITNLSNKKLDQTEKEIQENLVEIGEKLELWEVKDGKLIVVKTGKEVTDKDKADLEKFITQDIKKTKEDIPPPDSEEDYGGSKERLDAPETTDILTEKKTGVKDIEEIIKEAKEETDLIERAKTDKETAVTKEILDVLEIKKLAPIRKKILGKGLESDEVIKELKKFVKNPKVAKKTKDKINILLRTIDDKKQDLVKSESDRTGPKDITQDVSGRGPETVSVSPEGVTEPEGTGLGDTGRTVTPDDAREKEQRSALDKLKTEVTPEVVTEEKEVTPEVVTEEKEVTPEDKFGVKKRKVSTVGPRLDAPLDTSAKKGPTLDVSTRSLTQKEALDIYKFEKMKGKTDQEASDVVRKAALEREINALKQEGISEEEINRRLQEAGEVVEPVTGEKISALDEKGKEVDKKFKDKERPLTKRELADFQRAIKEQEAKAEAEGTTIKKEKKEPTLKTKEQIKTEKEKIKAETRKAINAQKLKAEKQIKNDRKLIKESENTIQDADKDLKAIEKDAATREELEEGLDNLQKKEGTLDGAKIFGKRKWGEMQANKRLANKILKEEKELRANVGRLGQLNKKLDKLDRTFEAKFFRKMSDAELDKFFSLPASERQKILNEANTERNELVTQINETKEAVKGKDIKKIAENYRKDTAKFRKEIKAQETKFKKETKQTKKSAAELVKIQKQREADLKKKVNERKQKLKGTYKKDVEKKMEGAREKPYSHNEPFGGRKKDDNKTPIQNPDVSFTQEDYAKVDTLLEKEIKPEVRITDDKTGETAANVFFEKQLEATDTIDVIAHIIVDAPWQQFQNKKDPNTGESIYSKEDVAYFKDQSPINAELAGKWIENNLSKEANDSFNALKKKYAEEKVKTATLDTVKKDKNGNLVDITDVFETRAKPSLEKGRIQTEEEKRNALSLAKDIWGEGNPILDMDTDELLLPTNHANTSALPLSPQVKSQIKQGNLGNALRAAGITAPSKSISEIVEKLETVIKDTKIEIVDNLKSEAGKPIAGLFDPKTNTIKLDSKKGMNHHVLLHEATHAVTSHILENKSHPVTKQLNKLFNEVKDSLDTAYGTTNLAEFVAEVFSNPEFQKKLAGIDTKGQPIKAWQRFVSTIKNFIRRLLGKQPVGIESALDNADVLIERILSPAPAYRHAIELHMASDNVGKLKNMLNNIDNKRKDLGYLGQKKETLLHRAKDMWKYTWKEKALWTYVKGLGSQALGDVGGYYGLKTIAKVHKVFEDITGEYSNMDKLAEAANVALANFYNKNSLFKNLRKNRKAIDNFNTIIMQTTMNEVNLSKPESTYKNDKEKLKIYKELRPLWISIGPEGQAAVKEMWATWPRFYKELQRAVEGKIDDIVTDKEARKTLKKTFYEKLFKPSQIDPYSPLSRKGDYRVIFDALNPTTNTKEPVVQHFETKSGAEEHIANIKEKVRKGEWTEVDVDSIEIMGVLEPIKGERQASFGFIKSSLSILDKAGVDQETINNLLSMVVDTLPESSFVKNLKKRQGVLGAREDAFAVFNEQTYKITRQIAHLKGNTKLQRLRSELQDEIEAVRPNTDLGKQGMQKILKEETDERIKFAMNPPKDKTAAFANRIAFLGTIGWNPSSAFVNLSQIPLVMAPVLSGKYGLVESHEKIAFAMKLYGSSGFSREIVSPAGTKTKITGMLSIDNFFIYKKNEDGSMSLELRDDIGANEQASILNKETKKEVLRLEELKGLVKIALKRGGLARSIFYDTLTLDSGGKSKNAWDVANASAAWMFHQQERMNRQVAMTSTYFLELDRMKTNPTTAEQKMTEVQKMEAAAEQALYQSQEMNGGATLMTAPSIAQKGWGRVFFMFKSYGAQMYYTILKTAKESWAGETPEARKIALNQLVGLMGSSVLLAGVQGLPFYGAVMSIINTLDWIQDWMTDEDDDWDPDNVVREAVSEGWYKGPVNYLTGVDVATRIGLSNLLFRSNAFNEDADYRVRWSMNLLGPAGSVFHQLKMGFDELNKDDGSTERAIEKMLPSAFRNLWKGLPDLGFIEGRYSREGIRTRAGDAIVHRKDLSNGSLWAQMFGFAPTEYTRKTEQNMAKKGLERKVNEKRTSLSRRWSLSVLNNIGNHYDIIKDIEAFNKKWPNWSIDASTLIKSLEAAKEKRNHMVDGIYINPKLSEEIHEMFSFGN